MKSAVHLKPVLFCFFFVVVFFLGGGLTFLLNVLLLG